MLPARAYAGPIAFIELPDQEHDGVDPVPLASPCRNAQHAVEELLDLTTRFGELVTVSTLLERIAVEAANAVSAHYGAVGVIGHAGHLDRFVETRSRRTVDQDGCRAFTLAGRTRTVGLLFVSCREYVPGIEDRLASLVVAAGNALDTALTLDESRRRNEWLQASVDITSCLMSDDGDGPLRIIAERALQLADADSVNIVLPAMDPSRWMVEVAVGLGADELVASTYSIDGALSHEKPGRCRPVLVADVSRDTDRPVYMSAAVPLGPLMILPLSTNGDTRGALVVGRVRGRALFDPFDLDMMGAFANQAVVALELAEARDNRERVAVLLDHDRIARDLHDHVIQRLFGAGLSVERVESALGQGDPHIERLSNVVTDVNETIRQIRATIFALHGPLGPDAGSARRQLSSVAGESAHFLGFSPSVSFAGPVDTVVSDSLVTDLVAVAREGLTNVARHASASHVDVRLSLTSGHLTLELTDDGVGMGVVERRSGLANLRSRALEHRGSMTVGDSSSKHDRKGTTLRWTVPMK